MSNGLVARDDPAKEASIQRQANPSKGPWRKGILGVAVAAVLVATVSVRLLQMRSLLPFSVINSVPGRGEQVFALVEPATAAQFNTLLLHAQDSTAASYEYREDGVVVSATEGFALLSARGVGITDVIADFRARELEGSSGFAIQLRGCASDGSDDDDFYRVDIEPQSGALGIDRARCGPGFTVESLVPTQPRLHPVPAGTEVPLTIVVQGQTIRVYSGGQMVAEGMDSKPPLRPGGVRLGVYSPGAAELTGLTIYRLP
jgi:hypothetical protein